ncbi:MAG: hypothetical protein QMD22_09105 [archaeon]|nr:hypothetical protein [archaeon]
MDKVYVLRMTMTLQAGIKAPLLTSSSFSLEIEAKRRGIRE